MNGARGVLSALWLWGEKGRRADAHAPLFGPRPRRPGRSTPGPIPHPPRMHSLAPTLSSQQHAMSETTFALHNASIRHPCHPHLPQRQPAHVAVCRPRLVHVRAVRARSPIVPSSAGIATTSPHRNVASLSPQLWRHVHIRRNLEPVVEPLGLSRRRRLGGCDAKHGTESAI